MHRAPAVSTEVERPTLVAWLLIVLAALSLLIVGIAGRQTDYAWSIFFVFFLSTAIALCAWWASPIGQFSWDGHHWFWSRFRGERICTVKICLDFQWGVLLYLRNPSASSVWLFLSRKTCGAQWIPLRRALLTMPDQGAP